MAPSILIAGGYGVIGGTIARLIRSISSDVELVLAGRHPKNGAALAQELGHARTAHLDVTRAIDLDDLASVDLIISALYDPSNALIGTALTHGIAHIGIATKADDVAPIAMAALRSPPKRPIVLAGHSMAGAATLVALRSAERFGRVDRIAVAALYDMRDPVGPMTAHDAEMLVARALIRAGGNWQWLDGRQHGRPVRFGADDVLEAYPAGLLDAPSLAAATGAPGVRLDFVQGDSFGTRAGKAASSDAIIDIVGVVTSGEPQRSRTVVSDPRGLAHLTALGVLVATERVLGLDGRAPAAAGLHAPETLADPGAAVARFEQFGVRVTTEMEGMTLK